jgi:hypothetical protein
MAGEELSKKEGDGSGTNEPATPSAPLPGSPTIAPAPPLPPGVQPQAPFVQFAQQIIQKPGSLNDFNPDIQRMLVEGLQQQDRYSYDLACKNIDHEDKMNARDVDDRAHGRKQLLVLVISILVVGTGVDLLLLYRGQYQLATQLLTYGGTALISALGGFGIGRTKTFGGTKSD